MSSSHGVPQLVFLYGPPAVGKLTVAQELAARRPFRVLHNHLTIDPVATVLPFGTDAFWAVVGVGCVNSVVHHIVGSGERSSCDDGTFRACRGSQATARDST
jgi:hypothetical protein